LDPYVFGPPGSGSISQRYGSGSFYRQAKIGRKSLISSALWLLFDFLSLKNDVNVPSKSNKQKNLYFKFDFFWHLEGQWRKQQDPQNVMEPQHWEKVKDRWRKVAWGHELCDKDDVLLGLPGLAVGLRHLPVVVEPEHRTRTHLVQTF
jgi:hypothetical protein